MDMKFVVHEDCIGCNLCALTCPEVFSMNDNEKAQAIEGEVASEHQQKAIKAMQQCPVAAIERTE